jgi:hypothetical protein
MLRQIVECLADVGKVAVLSLFVSAVYLIGRVHEKHIVAKRKKGKSPKRIIYTVNRWGKIKRRRKRK